MIEPAEYEGPDITVHAARLLAYKPSTTVKSRIPANLELDDQGDDLAEEIQIPRVVEEPRVELGVPVKLGVPEFDIVDIMARKQMGKKQKNKVQPDSAKLPENPSPQPEEEPPSAPDNEPKDEISRKRGRALQTDGENEGQIPESKSGKLRPKRTRGELRQQILEARRRQEIDTGTETDQPQSKRQPRPEEMRRVPVFNEARQFLESSDDEMLNTIRTLQVDITQESDEPVKGTQDSACYDLTAHSTEVVPAHGIAMIPLNLKMAIPPGYFLLLLSRSGLAVKGVVALGGVIDADYRGPVCAILANSTDQDFVLKKGQRCCQGVFLQTNNANFRRTDLLEKTDRGSRGFGSTDEPGTNVPAQV